jgi:hypothetical protein
MLHGVKQNKLTKGETMAKETQRGHKYICTVAFGDTEHGSTQSRGWWNIMIYDAEVDGQYRQVGRVPSSADREREGNVFSAEDAKAEALAAARRFFPTATLIRASEFGYDVFG